MWSPEKELDTVGKRTSGADAQPVAFPDTEAIGFKLFCMDGYGSHKFSINQCESHIKSDLDTISLSIDSRDTRKLKFLIDTGAEISIIRSSSLTPGVEYQLQEGVDIKRITNTVMKTEGTINLKLFTDTHETIHSFHVLRENSNMHYDAILGKDFLEERGSVIDYCSRQIIMNNEVVVNFDSKPTVNTTELCRLIFKARTETIVRVTTASKGLGLLSKSELIPGVCLAASLARAVNGGCLTNIINTRKTDVTIDLSRVDL
jgi:hypothetical protein